MHARVIELDALTNAVGARAEDDDGLTLARAHLVFLVVGRVVVGRTSSKLGSTGVNGLEDWVDAEGTAHFAHSILRQATHSGDLAVGEAVALCLGEHVARECLGLTDAPGNLVEEEHLVEEPWVDLRRLVELLKRRTAADRLLDLDEAPLGANRRSLNECTGLLGETVRRPCR